jgi:hypothetical protein
VEAVGQNILELKEDITPSNFVEEPSDEEDNPNESQPQVSQEELDPSSTPRFETSHLDAEYTQELPRLIDRQMSRDESRMSPSPVSKQGSNEVNYYFEGNKQNSPKAEKSKSDDKSPKSAKRIEDTTALEIEARLPIMASLPCTYQLTSRYY